jgi:hypothetical protein
MNIHQRFSWNNVPLDDSYLKMRGGEDPKERLAVPDPATTTAGAKWNSITFSSSS